MISKNVKAISPGDLLVYLCLSRYKNSVTGESTVSVSRMAKLTSSSPVTVLTSIKRLSDSGYIVTEKRGRDNVYKLNAGFEASSYAFLDEQLSHKQKEELAVQKAIVPKVDKADESVQDNKLYDYVVQLEQKVVTLAKQTEVLAKALNKALLITSTISGQSYHPVELPQ